MPSSTLHPTGDGDDSVTDIVVATQPELAFVPTGRRPDGAPSGDAGSVASGANPRGRPQSPVLLDETGSEPASSYAFPCAIGAWIISDPTGRSGRLLAAYSSSGLLSSSTTVFGGNEGDGSDDYPFDGAVGGGSSCKEPDVTNAPTLPVVVDGRDYRLGCQMAGADATWSGQWRPELDQGTVLDRLADTLIGMRGVARAVTVRWVFRSIRRGRRSSSPTRFDQPELDALGVFYGDAPETESDYGRIHAPVLGLPGGDPPDARDGRAVRAVSDAAALNRAGTGTSVQRRNAR